MPPRTRSADGGVWAAAGKPARPSPRWQPSGQERDPVSDRTFRRPSADCQGVTCSLRVLALGRRRAAWRWRTPSGIAWSSGPASCRLRPACSAAASSAPASPARWVHSGFGVGAEQLAVGVGRLVVACPGRAATRPGCTAPREHSGSWHTWRGRTCSPAARRRSSRRAGGSSIPSAALPRPAGSEPDAPCTASALALLDTPAGRRLMVASADCALLFPALTPAPTLPRESAASSWWPSPPASPARAGAAAWRQGPARPVCGRRWLPRQSCATWASSKASRSARSVAALQVALEGLEPVAQLLDRRVGRGDIGLRREHLAIGAGRRRNCKGQTCKTRQQGQHGLASGISGAAIANRARSGACRTLSWPKSYPPPAPEMWRTGRRNARLRQLIRLGNHVGVRVAVAAPGAFVMARVDRLVLAEGDRGDATAVDALRFQVVGDGIGAAGAQRDVVFAQCRARRRCLRSARARRHTASARTPGPAGRGCPSASRLYWS